MNKFVAEELKKCRVAKLPPYDEFTKHMIIPQANSSEQFLQVNKCFLVQLEPYILNPPEGFTLHDNWNQGRKPPREFLKIEVSQVMGKMIKVNSIGFDYATQTDTNEIWEGWLPKKSINILQEL